MTKRFQRNSLRPVDRRPEAWVRVKGWIEQGYTNRAIGTMTGLPVGTVSALVTGYNQGLARRLTYATATKILAAKENPTGGLVPSAGTMRRLRALAVMGWPGDLLGQRLGLSESILSHIRLGRGHLTRPSIARSVRELYEELWNVPGPSHYARARALNKGWLPPMAWDDETIDDPRIEPPTADAASAKRFEIEDIEFILTDQPFATTQQLADRLDVDRSAIQNRLKRAGRDDLLAVLARNATLARAA